ncbi:MAG: DEAD/DEAH box helicase [Actinobacteria bacterium]|nr:DEAD/DEAH box helicase [Actinomycetota bacterium]
MTSPLEHFSPITRTWFEGAFHAPTPVQEGAWDAVSRGDDVLVVGPTGSGKTLAGFLWSIDSLVTSEPPADGSRLRILYVSPLKALAADIERNLRSPLTGIRASAQRLGRGAPDIRVAMRTGDTPQEERRRFARDPSDILITTPESLFLLLTSRAREALRSVETVIVDEIHAVAHSKRGAHLALSLERLDELTARRAQRLGLSATVRPLDEVARFLGGEEPATIVAPPSDKTFDLSIVVPVEDMADIGEESDDIVGGPAMGAEARSSVWPHVEERLLELIERHKSTIVFVNSRRLSERLCSRLNELAEREVARAHHGSVSKEQRLLIEEDLKMARLPAVVATSSLELGIDMAAVDLVIQVESPASVASGLQRIGRAGHQVGEVSRGVIFPKFRHDLLESAVVVDRMRSAEIEAIAYPRNPLDVLAQHVVAMVAMDDWAVDDLERVVKRAAPFNDLPRNALEATLDMLSGRYPSHEFATLRPRLNWDRIQDRLSARTGAQRVAVTSGGTIPDRGLFGVFLGGEKSARVGELDEEMVYESRVGETFLLGASSWLIEDITPDRVIVTPAPGQPGKFPFWHGDAPGRPVELGRALGRFTRDLMSAPALERTARLKRTGLDEHAANNLTAYLEEQKEATGIVPDDRTIVVEKFRDEIGDWRICILSHFGAPVHAPWAQAIEARLNERLGLGVQSIYTDDGIVLRLPETDDIPEGSALMFDPEEIEDIVVDQIGNSALFASRFRECAVRSLLLPRRRPGSRTPLWQQRQKSALLLQVASRYEQFPVVLEAMRECLQDVFDLPALVDLMRAIRSREIRIVEVETGVPSPFAGSLQFGFVSVFMYEGDSPLAERRAQALSLDRSLLAEIMGREELRELIDEDSLLRLELELQYLEPDRKARDADGLHDLLRRLGDLSTQEIAARVQGDGSDDWLKELTAERRVARVMIAGDERWIAAEDAGRYRDALGVALPRGLPAAFLETDPGALGYIVGRYAATHGPFVPRDIADRYGIGVAPVETSLRGLEMDGRVVEGEFRPGGTEKEWIDVEVLRSLRRRSLAAFRKEIEPVAPDVLARFSVAWHGVGAGPVTATPDSVYEVVEQLQGVPVPASVLEHQILGSRLPGYTPTLLDQLCAAGEIVWAGVGPLGSDDGWIALATAGQAGALLPSAPDVELSPLADQVRTQLEGRGAQFFRQIGEGIGSSDDAELLLALWELVWAGHATNDTLAPLRALVQGTSTARSHSRRRRRRPTLPMRSGPPAAAGRWSLLPTARIDGTRRLHAYANQLLLRHGIVTRGSITMERVPGGFAGVYPVLRAMEESGRCRRGYFVEGLGGAQFAVAGAVDRMRALGSDTAGAVTHVLAAADPANPYGATLPWPEREDMRHRPGRKAGAIIVLVDGKLVLYVERGGKTLLSFTEREELLEPAADALVLAAREGKLGKIAVERADGGTVFESPIADKLMNAGFRLTPRGLRIRA